MTDEIVSLSEKKLSNNMIKYGSYRNKWFYPIEDVVEAVETLKKEIRLWANEDVLRTQEDYASLIKIVNQVFGVNK